MTIYLFTFNALAECDRKTDEPSKDAVCSGNKKFLLRSAPVLLLFDAASVEESEAPVFETALNFGTTHHLVRSKQTTVCFGEEGSSSEDVECLKDHDYNEEDDLMFAEDSGKLETADDFTVRSCFRLMNYISI